MNKVQLIGHTGKDPEITTLNGGKKIAKFSIATSESYTDKEGNRVEKSEWHNCIAFGPIAEIFEKYVKKGKQMYIEGKLQTSSWDDKETGKKRYSTDIIVQGFEFLGKKESSDSVISAQESPKVKTQNNSSNGVSVSSKEEIPALPEIDDLPF
jgi:single-strand DNA-binding protein